MGKHALVAADLGQGLRHVELRTPGSLEGLADVAGASLQRRPRNLLGVCTRVCKADRKLEGARTNADLGPDGHVAGARSVIDVGQVAVAIAEIDLHVGRAVVTRGSATERTDDAYPHVLLTDEKRGRMSVQ